MSDSQVTVTAEVFAEKLKQKYPQRATALGDQLIAAFVHDHPQYRVDYDGIKAVSVSWHRTPALTTAASSTPAAVSAPAPDPKVVAVGAQPEQRLKQAVLSSPTYPGKAPALPAGHDDSGSESQVRTLNRRRQPRVPCKRAKAYVIADSVPGVVVDVVDISRGGLRFVSYEQFRPHMAVTIATHYIEGGQNIFQDGLIVRARRERSGMLPSEYAVKFSLG